MNSNISIKNNKSKKKGIARFLDWVERVGNKLPHPFTLFVYLVLFVIIISFIISRFGIQVKHPVNDEIIIVKNLLSVEGLKYILLNLISNFVEFKPLGLVLTMMIGIGLAEQTGLMSAFMRKFILGASEKLLIMSIFLIGICGNIASDAAVIIVPPLAGAIFYSVKKNPLVGIAAGYAAACAGFTANLIVAGTDALLAGITEEAAHIVDETVTVSPLVNYYFMFVSTLVLTVIGAWITTKYVEKQAGPYTVTDKTIENEEDYKMKENEKKGLKIAGKVTLIYWGIILLALIPKTSPLRNPDGGLIPSTFISSIVPFILFWFIAIGIAYGKKSGSIKTDADIPRLMGKAMEGMAGYIVLVFVISQFVSYFNWTNLGLVIAISLGNLLKAANFTGFGMIVCVILITMFINLFIGSGSAKWALLAPVFVPMFLMLGYSPAFAQLAYRVGDSATNAITPLFPYFPILIGFMKKYDDNLGMGTAMSYLMPYTIGFGLVWIIMMAVWFYLKLPLGPGANVFL